MLHTPLNSSMIISAGWQDGILEIEFARGGKRYQYHADESLFNELVADASPGSFFHSRIKGKIQQVTTSTSGGGEARNEAVLPPQTDYPSMANEEEIEI